MSNLFTAHCRFGVTITGAKTAEDALKIFEQLDIVLVGADQQEGVRNWKGIDFCPPVHEPPNGFPPSRDDQFEVYAYIKVFLEGEDVDQARNQLDQLYPDVWINGAMDTTFPPRFTCSAWDFSIDPSVGEDLDSKNRTALPGSVAKEWQKAPRIAAEDRIAPSDPPLEAARKATRQFKRVLQPFELCWILKANGIDLSKKGAWQEAAREISEQLAKNG